MHRCCKYLVSLSRYHTGLMCTSILSSAFMVSANLQAEEDSRISRYTSHREKTPELLIPPYQANEKPSVKDFTLQRERTPESHSLDAPVLNLPDIEVIENSGNYRIKVVANINAPAKYVRFVLTDYTHIYRLNPSIIESEVLDQSDDGSAVVRTRVIACAAYFCEELERVEKVQQLPSGDIYAEIVPELSQFKSGKTLWQIKMVDGRCEVIYQAEMEPDIFIPPVVGRFLIKKSIRQEMQTSIANLEKISSILAGRELQQDKRLAEKCLAQNAALDARCQKNAESYLGINE